MLFPSSGNIVALNDEYPPFDPGVEYFRDPQADMELPMLDVVGKKTVIWSEDPSAWLLTSNRVLRRGDAKTTGRVNAGFVIDPPYSTRIALMPTSADAKNSWLGEMQQSMQKGRRPGRFIFRDKRDQGTVNVTIERSQADLEEFRKIYDRITKKDTVEVANILVATKMVTDEGLYNMTMDFRYPPLPPTQGFNIFGPMSFLRFEGAIGHVAAASKMIDINAPSTIEFKDIEHFKAHGGVITVPVQVKAGRGDAQLQFSGVSEAWINNNPALRTEEASRPMTDYTLLGIGSIQAIAAAIAIGRAIVGRASS